MRWWLSQCSRYRESRWGAQEAYVVSVADSSSFEDKRAARKLTPTVITNAHTGTSREMASREKRYAITMAIRTACFVSMIFADGPLRWVLLAGAVFLPYIAVVLANQANTKTSAVDRLPASEPSEAPALTSGPVSPEVIEGELVDVAPDDDRLVQHDRVA